MSDTTTPDDPSPAARAKARMRLTFRERRRALTGSQRASAAAAVAASLETLPAWSRGGRLALYMAADGEIGTDIAAARARAAGFALFLPVVGSDGEMRFARWRDEDALQPNRFGIPEPPARAERAGPASMDVICLPLVAWDTRGGRLGMGGGYYDRLLAGVTGTLRVGLAHTCQRADAVPRDDWDLRLDYVATETGLHACSDA